MLFLASLIDLYSLVVLVAVILSWVPLDPRNPLVTIAHALTERCSRRFVTRFQQPAAWICRRWFCCSRCSS
jgi:uncharacterized protein YggT (Ycf19 family)